MSKTIEEQINESLLDLLEKSNKYRSEIWENISNNKDELSPEEIISTHGINVYQKFLELSYLTKHIESITDKYYLK
jgi:hypothetical protein